MNNTDTKRQMPKKTEATSNADADAADAGPFFSHTCARYNKVENEEKETGKKKHEEEEKEMKGTEPLSPLPYFPQDHD